MKSEEEIRKVIKLIDNCMSMDCKECPIRDRLCNSTKLDTLKWVLE